MNAWEDIGNRTKLTREEIERMIASVGAAPDEQEQAEAIAFKREMARRHAAYNAPAFFGDEEQTMISYELARKLGASFNTGDWIPE